MRKSCLPLLAGVGTWAWLAATVQAQLISHPDPTLHYVYPAGGRPGQTVAVELGGLNGLAGARDVLIEGPAGISVRDVKAINVAEARATFVIAADAVPGRRLVRVVGGANGLTCCRYFFVGQLPEIVEKEGNNTPATAQAVTLPAVVNGRVNPAMDIDCYAFDGRAGQRLVAAVLAHGMDSRLRSRAGHGGFLDTSLEVLDSQGRVIAAAEDTVGLDPTVECTLPAAGRYVVRIQALGFGGAPGAVYRLTLGNVPYPVAVFPPGGQRGQALTVDLVGLNLLAKAQQRVTIPPAPASPWQTLRLDHPQTDGRELPFLWGDHPEIVEAEPNDQPAATSPLRLPVTINGRFDRPGDIDCFRVSLKKGQAILVDVTAQRHLRSPVDTLLEITDAAGKKLLENDDAQMYSGQCEHDYPAGDSRLEFTAPQDGDYFLRLSEQTGAGGSQAIYRLTVEPLKPDFLLHHWPDAVPVWGAGNTSAFVVQVQRWGGLAGDIQLKVEGLPEGWKGSGSIMSAANYYPPLQGLNQKALLTITAPAGAAVGTLAPFRVVGRVQQDGKVIERQSQPLTLYGSSHTDRMHLRYSPQAYAAVAPPLDTRLETSVQELTVPADGTVQIPVKIHRLGSSKGDIGISIDGETVAAGCAWRTPLTVKADQTEVMLPLTVRERRAGTYGIVVSRSWSADLRAGRPGPCTPLILLHVQPPAKKSK